MFTLDEKIEENVNEKEYKMELSNNFSGHCSVISWRKKKNQPKMKMKNPKHTIKTKPSPPLWKMYLSVQKSSVSLVFSFRARKTSLFLSKQQEPKHLAVTAATSFMKAKG